MSAALVDIQFMQGTIQARQRWDKFQVENPSCNRKDARNSDNKSINYPPPHPCLYLMNNYFCPKIIFRKGQ